MARLGEETPYREQIHNVKIPELKSNIKGSNYTARHYPTPEGARVHIDKPPQAFDLQNALRNRVNNNPTRNAGSRSRGGPFSSGIADANEQLQDRLDAQAEIWKAQAEILKAQANAYDQQHGAFPTGTTVPGGWQRTGQGEWERNGGKGLEEKFGPGIKPIGTKFDIMNNLDPKEATPEILHAFNNPNIDEYKLQELVDKQAKENNVKELSIIQQRLNTITARAPEGGSLSPEDAAAAKALLQQYNTAVGKAKSLGMEAEPLSMPEEKHAKVKSSDIADPLSDPAFQAALGNTPAPQHQQGNIPQRQQMQPPIPQGWAQGQHGPQYLNQQQGQQQPQGKPYVHPTTGQQFPHGAILHSPSQNQGYYVQDGKLIPINGAQQQLPESKQQQQQSPLQQMLAGKPQV
jgi:hypothetical protein